MAHAEEGMAKRDTGASIQAICQRQATEMGYELVDAGIEKEGAGRYLRIYLDKPEGITLTDCETYHRAIQPSLEQIDYDFLEVCSPGLDRPIKTERDFEKNKGKRVVVKLYKPVDGRKEYEGVLAGLIDGEIVLSAETGELRFAMKSASLVKPVVDVSSLLESDITE